MPRNRALTEQRLVDTVGQIVSEEGIEGVRINRVAKRSGVNKILIYRYFGGINGLREAYIKQSKPVVALPSLDVSALRQAPLDVFFETFCEYVIDEYRLLRQNPQAQAVLKANLLNHDAIPSLLTTETAQQYRIMIDELAATLGTKYGRSFAAVINSSMTLLTFLSQQQRTAFGFDLGTDAAWNDIEITVRHLFRGAYLYTKERLEQEAQSAAPPISRAEKP